MSGMEEGENWSTLCSLGGQVSTLALILEGLPHNYVQYVICGWSKTIDQGLRSDALILDFAKARLLSVCPTNVLK